MCIDADELAVDDMNSVKRGLVSLAIGSIDHQLYFVVVVGFSSGMDVDAVLVGRLW